MSRPTGIGVPNHRQPCRVSGFFASIINPCRERLRGGTAPRVVPKGSIYGDHGKADFTTPTFGLERQSDGVLKEDTPSYQQRPSTSRTVAIIGFAKQPRRSNPAWDRTVWAPADRGMHGPPWCTCRPRGPRRRRGRVRPVRPVTRGSRNQSVRYSGSDGSRSKSTSDPSAIGRIAGSRIPIWASTEAWFQ